MIPRIRTILPVQRPTGKRMLDKLFLAGVSAADGHGVWKGWTKKIPPRLS